MRLAKNLAYFLLGFLFVLLARRAVVPPVPGLIERGGPWRASRNLMLTMLLGGLWHGANWTFVLWGFLHGLGLAVHRLWTARVGGAGAVLGRAPRLATVLGTSLTFAWVVACFTIFRCADIGTAFRFFWTPGVADGAARVSLDLWALVALLGGAHFVIVKRREWFQKTLHAIPDVAFYPALGASTATLLYFTPLSNEAFIYFQF